MCALEIHSQKLSTNGLSNKTDDVQMEDPIFTYVKARLSGLPVTVTHPCKESIYIYSNIEGRTTNRWDHISFKVCGKGADAQITLENVTVALYINHSTLDESAIVCHFFHKCIDLLGLCPTSLPIDKWAYVSKRRLISELEDSELQKIKEKYITFLSFCRKNHLCRPEHEERACRRMQRKVWDHWMEVAIRPITGSLYKLYEMRFSKLATS